MTLWAHRLTALMIPIVSCVLLVGCPHPHNQGARVTQEPSEAPLCDRLPTAPGLASIYAPRLPEQRQIIAMVRQTPLPADYRARVDAAFVTTLKEPDSRKISAIFTPSGSVVCGMINARNSFGGYTGPQPFMGYFDAQGHVIFLQAYSAQELVNLRKMACPPGNARYAEYVLMQACGLD